MKLIDISTPRYPATFAMVDDDDFDFLNQWTWYAEKRRNTFYAARTVTTDQGRKTGIRMHRQLVSVGDGFEVDHADGNGINNQRFNLRSCTVSRNQRNRRSGWGASKYKGVVRDSFNGCWQSRITIDRVTYGLGAFESEIDAARRYDHAAKAHFGEFARFNFPNSDITPNGISVVRRGKRDLPKCINRTPSGKFCVQKMVSGKSLYLGTFPSLDDAVRARDSAGITNG